MRKKITFSLAILALFFSVGLSAQTAGTLTCVYTTVSSGGYTPKNCLAAWIETSSGTFIKTKFKYCSSGNYDHLATWTGKSGQNVVDATSGSTRTANGLMTLVWNGTDVSSALVADGTYKVWIEFAWASSLTTGKTVQSFSFTKGATADHQAPADLTNLTGITLDWAPASGAGIEDQQAKPAFTVAPNPVTNQSMIKYSITEFSDVTVSLYDISGRLVDVLLDDNQTAGNYSLPLSSKGNVKAGVYLVKINTGKTQQTQRIIVSE
ncbi:MAG: T9SS type A sorting domain-containing protein [Bacteroidota bacterium]